MKTYSRLFEALISMGNLETAYKNARKGKSTNAAIQKFDTHLRLRLVQLQLELKSKTKGPPSIHLYTTCDIYILHDTKLEQILHIAAVF